MFARYSGPMTYNKHILLFHTFKRSSSIRSQNQYSDFKHLIPKIKPHASIASLWGN